MRDAGGLRARLSGRPERALRGVSLGWTLAAGAFVFVASLLGLALGPVDLGLGGVAREVLSHVPFLGVESSFSETQDAILWELRAPRVVLGLLVGAMLAIAGASYQGVFRNPLADPYLLGAAAGAGLGATIVIAYDLAGDVGPDLRPVAAFVGAMLAVGVAYGLGRSVGGGRPPRSSWPASPLRRSSPRSRPMCSSAASKPSRRSTAGFSASSRPRVGRTC